MLPFAYWKTKNIREIVFVYRGRGGGHGGMLGPSGQYTKMASNKKRSTKGALKSNLLCKEKVVTSLKPKGCNCKYAYDDGTYGSNDASCIF